MRDLESRVTLLEQRVKTKRVRYEIVSLHDGDPPLPEALPGVSRIEIVTLRGDGTAACLHRGELPAGAIEVLADGTTVRGTARP